MAFFLTLEDGRICGASNIAGSGVLWLASEQLPAQHDRLRRWLADVSERPTWMDFDLRGLSAQDRAAFWQACRAAMDSLLAEFGPEPDWPGRMFAGSYLSTLLDNHRRIEAGQPSDAELAGEPAKPFDPIGIVDLDDIWSRDDEAAPARDEQDGTRWDLLSFAPRPRR